jgi:hypothetical protein
MGHEGTYGANIQSAVGGGTESVTVKSMELVRARVLIK